mgnify:CR=1 FL=1
MSQVDSPENGVIIIEDDGYGMDLDILQNVWLEPGSDHKEQLLRQGNPDCPRLPLGEKGIGRFAAHKLGKKIELISRKKGKKEVYCYIDWEDFKKYRYLKDVPVHFCEREPEYFKNNSGTRIIIRDLNKPWNRGTVRNVYRSIKSLQYPFISSHEENHSLSQTFQIQFDIDRNDWISDILSWEDIQKYSLFKFYCEIVGKDPDTCQKIDEITQFHYEFNPWSEMDKVKGRVVTNENSEYQLNKKLTIKTTDEGITDESGTLTKNIKRTALSDFNIGKICFEGIIFDRDVTVMRLGIHKDKKGFKEFLDRNGGIKVYRDGIRVYDYGETGNDWLNLGIRRVNRLGDHISNNIIIGAIYLDRKTSGDLIEKTNREGFIESDAAERFRSSILDAIGLIELFRNIDKEKIRIAYSSKSKSEPVRFSLEKLRNLIDQINDEKIRKEMLEYITKIENDYARISEILLKSAGSARNLGMVIHEIDKNIAQIIRAIKKQNDSEVLLNLTKKLSDIVSGYTSLIKKTAIVPTSAEEIIDEALSNIDYRLKAHNIEIIKKISPGLSQFEIKCNRSLIISSVMNLIDNSIYWLEKKGKPNKKIFVSISDEESGFITIVVADNGPGFLLPTELITEPYVTGKKDGMGLGLFIADKVMQDLNGKIIFPSWADFTIPDEFKEGAIVGLCFKKGEHA